MLVRLTRLCISVSHKQAGHVPEILWRHVIAALPRSLAVQVEPLLGQIHRRQKGHVGITVTRCPFDRLSTANPWNPNRRVRFLQGEHPRIYITEMEMFAFPAKRTRLGPGLNHGIM